MSQLPKSAKDLFLAALDIEPAERAAFLDEACAGDAALKRQIEALLRVHDEPDSLLDRPRIDLGLAGGAAGSGPAGSSPAGPSPAGPSPDAAIDLPITEKPGTVIGPYKLLQQIGEGGFGVVYMAKFEEAAQEFSKGVEPNVQHAFGAARSRAYALLGDGKMDDYREACARLIDEFKDSPVPSNRRFVAWLCTLAPHQKIDWKQVLEMARSDDHSVDDPVQDDNEVLYRAASLYRDGQYGDAVRVLTKLVAKLDRGSDRIGRYHLACSQYFLAMALHKTDDQPRAVMVLAEANGHATYVKGMNASWRYAVVHDTLRHEAQTLIQQEEGEAIAQDANLSTE